MTTKVASISRSPRLQQVRQVLTPYRIEPSGSTPMDDLFPKFEDQARSTQGRCVFDRWLLELGFRGVIGLCGGGRGG
jgi:hypothetical protein